MNSLRFRCVVAALGTVASVWGSAVMAGDSTPASSSDPLTIVVMDPWHSHSPVHV